MKPIVAIVGRSNVGKSTLFNRLIGKSKAIVKAEPGVTRDLNYGDVVERGTTFTLIDTGGFEAIPARPMGTDFIRQMRTVPRKGDRRDLTIPAKVREQAMLAIEEADVIIFLMDGRDGFLPSDRDVADILRKSGKPIVYAVNKIDTTKQEQGVSDFFSLGMENLFLVSSEQGRGVDELLDAIISLIPKTPIKEEKEERIKLAIVGRPNVGKSSLVNRLLGYERVVVSEIPGTTRDAIDTPFNYNKKKYMLIDTAGIRKKARIGMRLEQYSVMSAIKSIERCDIAFLIIDATTGITEQDEKVAGLIYERGKGCIIVVNKWDLPAKETNTAKEYAERIRWKAKFLQFAPIMFVSAITGQRVFKILAVVEEVLTQLEKRIPTAQLNKFFNTFNKNHQPPIYKNKLVKVYYITQTDIKPPTFVGFVNYPEGIYFSYERFLINQIREAFALDKVPIRLYFRKR
ncbi:MAG TPA: ribosome biogenesis GTPase Der [Deltaproteobacteria bacterium]|nr:MAG: ribosome biogenesis GTPase Der [Deltaproteobacteria bacterium GWD2_42_10]OGP48296.1 MAG: ribosome biogenesis GTPase Der [Deltaproteobacteria bacterium GWF2_42_12]OGQ73802.1 MAG: ribosome biogenesis GTPase Der [Deltaproteobacteria bacterium RIFOXYA2_FULL_42_10]HAG50346.1 ribosome biogenesis GTPase Der [Deltaproteobacteria bacterium]HCY19303.1 ribosome biogenesis GTPase Der [Deltaproteobacteria bacterium]